MSEAESDHDHQHQHGHLRGIAERISEHHERAVQRREEDELVSAANQAGFDLGADIGHPTVRHTATTYDVETDIGFENEPPELRD
ncbi:hypothetical protein [Planotetraspora sp. GP83]|uniref:hypothetical protein n=1 Tax=Planotetraspora sp. GP83 TaxID=3156264 RepID=UPI00351174E1